MVKFRIKNSLNINNIKYNKILENYNNGNSVVSKIEINDTIYYFKFLDKSFYNKLLLEVKYIPLLNRNLNLFPQYYEKDKVKVFIGEQCVFYGTKEISGSNINHNFSNNLLFDIVEKVALFHKEIINLTIDDGNDILEKSNDYQRLSEFFVEKKHFLIKYKLLDYVKETLNIEPAPSKFFLIHSDLNLNNIYFIDDKISSIIDFTDMKMGYLEDDLGKMWQNFLYLDYFNIDLSKKLIKKYESILNIKVNKNNIIISTIYRIIYRCYSMKDISKEYLSKTFKIIDLLLNEEVF